MEKFVNYTFKIHLCITMHDNTSFNLQSLDNSNVQFQQTFIYAIGHFLLIETASLATAHRDIFYVPLCMIPLTLQTSTRSLNRWTYVAKLARLYRCLRNTTSLRDKHFPSLSMQMPFFGPRMIELFAFLIRYTAREIILRACGAMASAASTMRPQLSGKERKKN